MLFYKLKFLYFTEIFLLITITRSEQKEGIDNYKNLISQNSFPINSNSILLSQKCFKQKYKQCSNVPIDCMQCSIDNNPKAADCVYGESILTNCTVKNITQCQGEKSFELSGVCRFCYQTPEWAHICTPMTSCRRDSPIRLYKVNCTVDPYMICLGSRIFYKNVECNWTSGYRHKVALTLSLCLGGFGIDRFYLGQYREGLGKLFSFGGLGVWTLIDVILIYVGYVGPDNGSIYI